MCLWLTYLLTYAHHLQWTIGHQWPPAITLCSGLLLSFPTSWSPAVSALLQCLTSNCCEAGLSSSSSPAGSRSGLGVWCLWLGAPIATGSLVVGCPCPEWVTQGLSPACLLVGCLTSQQHASVSQGWICTDNFMCFHTEIEDADPTFYLTQSQYTDTRLTSPSTDPTMPGEG